MEKVKKKKKMVKCIEHDRVGIFFISIFIQINDQNKMMCKSMLGIGNSNEQY